MQRVPACHVNCIPVKNYWNAIALIEPPSFAKRMVLSSDRHDWSGSIPVVKQAVINWFLFADQLVPVRFEKALNDVPPSARR